MRVYHVRTNIETGADNWGGNSLNKSFRDFDKMLAYVERLSEDERSNGYTVDPITDEERTQLLAGDFPRNDPMMIGVCWDDFIDNYISIGSEELD